VIKVKGQMRVVTSVQISAQQMRRSIALVKCTDLITGKSFEERFRPEDRVEGFYIKNHIEMTF
jgi:translation elongation factor P/translation initiation factor 5A